jgi:hypothetical protein
MKTKLATLVVMALIVCGVAVYVYASSDASSTEPSISSSSQSTPMECGGCSKKSDSDTSDEKKGCDKSDDKKSSDNSSGCDKSKSKSGCGKSK